MTEHNIQPECEHCGLCCSSYTVWMTNRDFDNDELEIKRLIEYHGCKAIRNSKGEMGLCVPISCIHLDKNNRCKIYSTRPKVCQEYYCARIIEEALKKEINGVRL